MSEWKKVKLGEITESCLGKMLDAAKNRGEYKPYLANLNVRWGSFDTDNLSLMRFEEDEDERYGIKYGDLIICEGGEPGRCAIWKEQLPDMKIQKALHRVRPKDGLVDNFYLFYWFLLAGKCNWIDQYCTGATIKHLPGQKLKEVIVDLPPIEVQHRIASILSRYDTLIENYQKQIKLLEEAAQRLYKEWFVELRFPGHENTKMVDGLPEGWERKKLIEFGCSLESGARPKGGVDSNLKDGIPSVGAENVIGLGKYNYSSEKLVTNQFYSQMRKGKIKDRDILIYKDGAYIGRTSLFQDGFPHKEMAVNEHVFLLHTLNENYQYYVFFTLYQKQYFEKMQKLNKNAAQPGLNQKALLDLVMLCPSENFVLSFRKAIEPLMKALFSKANQIRLLTEARDRLLPRLMGGEMEVSN